ncbi:MAG TPA: hypothetical protein DCS71_06340 [Flavobacteriales bacterium]|nr:hypothetical protein [Flavobacteriales bacterium]
MKSKIMTKSEIQETNEPGTTDTFWHYINPVCLAVGLVGMAMHFEVDLFDLGMYGLGLWGVTGALGLPKKGATK